MYLCIKYDYVDIRGQLTQFVKTQAKSAGFRFYYPGLSWRLKTRTAKNEQAWVDWFTQICSGVEALSPLQQLAKFSDDCEAAAAIPKENKREEFERILEKIGLDCGLGSIADYLGISERTARGWYADGMRRGIRPALRTARNKAIRVEDGEEERFSREQIDAALRQAG